MENNIKYLVDTNIWLELLLEQEKSAIVSQFFNTVSLKQIFISDFTLHSIGVILFKFKKLDILNSFVEDLFINGQIELLTIDPLDFHSIISNIEEFHLDFDDAYQLTVSKKYDMKIVSFDKDFNTKGINKITPQEIFDT